MYSSVCHGLRQTNEMIIFESLLTTFKASIIFEAAGAIAKIGLSLKPKRYNQVQPS